MKYFKSIIATALLGALLITSCNKGNQTQIKGIVKDFQQEESLVLKRLDFTSETVLDTLTVREDGSFSYRFDPGNDMPGYYYLYAGNKKIAWLILQNGVDVDLEVTRDGRILKLEGSPESLLLQEVNENLKTAAIKFDSLYTHYENAPEKEKEALSLELGRLFVKYKQETIRFLYEHPRSFVNTSVVFQSLPRQVFIFSDTRDAALLQRVYDSLSVDYPLSPYVNAIRDRYESMQKAMQMEDAFLNAEVTDFPNICLPGLDGQDVCLSSLKGKTIILSFWHSSNVDMRLDNRELQEMYNRYSPRGLEIYQVGLDTDKTAWATGIRDQDLPWISVCDGLGIYSPAVTTYNVVEIPTFFIIDKEGNIRQRLSNVQEVIREVKTLF
ncbi:MAG: TlpA disulfide reductase family protein [Bacteroidales bacterium]|jgi:peroxiredoxin|nr:TlpA disulfide reductase family protein [Bacteroidales bacterium]MDD3549089.1 TlpA disulfide reductase family protein [Bacteroidales bacterium]MDD4064854.1 TlpA disulfide reductase family protein [Bacteroidales bacterium]MDD5283002.1 TlpA disulfide reductase family protein [Bacteroidales bacterium]MDY0239399.1 TlpA disulfide reductase family protein [Bacteroidales bacterium]